MAPTLPFPTADQTSKKKRKRTLDDAGDANSQPQQPPAPNGSGHPSSSRPRPQKTGSISTLMNVMEIDSQPRDGTPVVASPERKLKRKKGVRKEDSIMEVDVAKEHEKEKEKEREGGEDGVEVHGRQKRLRKEPSVVEPVVLPPVPVLKANGVDEKKEEKKRKKKGQEAAVAMDGLKDGPLSEPALTPLQAAMREKLQGSLFRQYNETIYKSDSKTFHDLVKKDPSMFTEYHVGFRRQVTTWPTNPVEHYCSVLSSYPRRSLIVDLGCGDAALARTLVPQGFNVLSYDVVSDGEWVVEADVCERIPLPGSESGGGRVVDVVVCALSLMSTNWPQCVRETRRVLKDSGELKIAEVTSRFTDVKQFVTLVESLGFKLTEQAQPTTHFTLFDFKVAPAPQPPMSAKDWKATLKKGPSILKPCEYKRR